MRELRDEVGNLVAIYNQNEIACITRLVDKDQEFTAIILKSGNATSYGFTVEFIVNQLFPKNQI